MGVTDNAPTTDIDHSKTATPAEPTEAPAPSGDGAPGDNPDAPRKKRRRRRRGKKKPADGQAPEGATPDTEDDAHEDEPAPRREREKKSQFRARKQVEVTAEDAKDLFDEKTFADLGLRNSVLKALDSMGFKYPTRIQGALIPAVLSGRDVLGQAKTGSGKTAAFGLPLFHLATRQLPFQSLVLVPTRELAIQVAAELSELGQFTPIKVSAVFGGESVRTQSDRLDEGPEIIVATPGRLMDMVERRVITLANVKFAVLDEVDRMLDIGFRDDIRKILGMIKGEHRTIFVSATISPEIENLARKFMRDPEKIVSTSGSLTVSMVEQHYLSVEPWDKKQLLYHLLTHEEPELTIVFCRTKRTVDNLTEYLQRKGIDVQAIHGDLHQSKRNKVMSKLRDGHLSVVIASDLAARGLDVEGITHVINYDLPEDPEVYIHRIGRTARAGRRGVAWAFVSSEQGGLLTEIEKLANIEIPRMEIGRAHV